MSARTTKTVLARQLAYAYVKAGETPALSVLKAAKQVSGDDAPSVPTSSDQANETPANDAGTSSGDVDGSVRTLERQIPFESLFDDIQSARPHEVDALISRIRQTFADAPGFAAILARLTRAVVLEDEDLAREEPFSFGEILFSGLDYLALARRKLDGYRQLLASGWDYRRDPYNDELRQVERFARELVDEYRSRVPLAAEFLERYLDGIGGTITFDVDQLRGRDSVRAAEASNQDTFERWMDGTEDVRTPSHEIHSRLIAMPDGASFTQWTFWETLVRPGWDERDFKLSAGTLTLGDFGVVLPNLTWEDRDWTPEIPGLRGRSGTRTE